MHLDGYLTYRTNPHKERTRYSLASSSTLWLEQKSCSLMIHDWTTIQFNIKLSWAFWDGQRVSSYRYKTKMVSCQTKAYFLVEGSSLPVQKWGCPATFLFQHRSSLTLTTDDNETLLLTIHLTSSNYILLFHLHTQQSFLCTIGISLQRHTTATLNLVILPPLWFV